MIDAIHAAARILSVVLLASVILSMLWAGKVEVENLGLAFSLAVVAVSGRRQLGRKPYAVFAAAAAIVGCATSLFGLYHEVVEETGNLGLLLALASPRTISAWVFIILLVQVHRTWRVERSE